MNWFLYGMDLRHERIKHSQRFLQIQSQLIAYMQLKYMYIKADGNE